MSVTGSDLLRLICDFTNPLDDEGVRSPSLWDQLLVGVGPSGQSSGAKPGSRLPTDAGVLSLVTEVERAVGTTCRHVPAVLRMIERDAREPSGGADAWAKIVHRWIGEARHALGLVPARVVLPRGTRCPDCDAGWVWTSNGDGEDVCEPAVVLLWVEPARDAIDRVVCLACKGEWPASHLHAIAEHQRTGYDDENV